MTRIAFSIAIAIFAGIVSVYLLPPAWLEPLSAAAAICAAIYAIIVRLDAKTEPPAKPTAVAGALLSIVNLPEQPLAKVKEGWALTTFLASVAFLLALGLAVMVRANA
jgi:uncharacterized membrane protein YfcA